MTESLNRAFIKAYGKGRLQTAQQSVEKREVEGAELTQLIMHFDTATTPIPQPHFLGNRGAEPSVSAVHGPSRHPTRAASQSPRERTVSPQDSDNLRKSITEEMLRAGNWESCTISTYGGEFPEAKPESQVSDANGRAEKSSHEPVEVELADERMPEASRVDKPLSASQPPVEKPVDSSAEQIVRVDRPNGRGKANPSPKPSELERQHAAVDTGGRVREVNQHDAAQQGWEVGGERLRNGSKPPEIAPAHSAKAVEEGLRQARVKIFNPVWEVDRLQWPLVCRELIAGNSHNMQRVAQNLISACEEGLQVLAVTSPQSGEGSTTVACCLAMLAGTHGLNVAIIDTAIENPAISFQTNLDVEFDWRTALLNDMSIEEVAVHSIDDQVTLIPLLNPVHRHELSLSDERIASMLRELAASFDLVVVDMGHMDTQRNLLSALGEQGVVNAAVAVVDHRNSSLGRIEACLRRIRASGIGSVGLVENFAA